MKFETLLEGDIEINNLKISKMSAYTAKKISKEYNFQFDPVSLVKGDELYVAKYKNIIVGFIGTAVKGFVSVDNKPEIKVSEISFVETNPNYYRQGIASKLVNFAIENAKGSQAIMVQPYPEYISLYTKLGFKPANIKNFKNRYIKYL